MNSETIQQLQDEIYQEMSERLKNANFDKVLEKYGISGDNILKFQATLDLTKIQFSDAVGNQQVKDLTRAIPGQKLVIKNCDWCACWGCCS
ncbi:hypothetical protein [Iningainema tapete]|uniref:Uncharacterized protein n=1 Tax=Iningainema tapete BLCC-T55 TaxID=2748662 RepID=A0A8J6XI18_9CYAN|nr:hypothetical protein [Iningainema tapete]MBD2770572.1 hypothetical protein [Iningainema tapete BLCC-T55]